MDNHADLDTSFSYTLHSRLGSGGMGQLYWASKLHARGVKSRVVLKTSLRNHTAEIDGLAYEADLGMAAAGPGVVGYRAFFVWGQRGWIELEPIDGIDGDQLGRRARRSGQRIPPFVAVLMAIDLLETLSHLERRSIVHRDISPRNVMVSSTTGRVTLLDFGVARRMGLEPDPRFGRNLVGKVGFMAPEQAAGDLVDPSADLFSVSATLWAWLAGRPPLGLGTQAELLARLKRGVTESPSRYAPDIPTALDDLVRSGMAPRRADRPSSADAMRTQLLELLPDLLPPEAERDPRRTSARWIASLEEEPDFGDTRWVETT